MTNYHFTPTDAVLVAIDISKNRHEVLIAIPGKKRRKRLTVLSTKAEYERFVFFLTGLGLPVQIGFEPTGNYHRTLAWQLH